MSLLFHTGNDSLSLEQLKAKRDANTSERLRLAQEFQRLEIAGGECRSVESFDRNDLIGKTIVAGLLEIDDKNALAPADRLLLAQRRYLDVELNCLIEMQDNVEWTPRRLAFHKSANYERLSDLFVDCGDLGKMKEDIAPAFLTDAEEEMTIRAPLSRTTITAAPVTSKSESGWRYYRSFEKMTIQERNAMLEEVKNRYASTHSPCGLSDEDIQLKTDFHVFDPTSDLGILITYGCHEAPPAMQILADDVILVEAGRLLMGLPPELPNKESLIVRSVRSAKVHAHRCGSFIMTKFELLDLVKRYTLQHKGKRMVDVMPEFDPDTDLGKLILWGKYTPSPAMQISLPHRQQINEFRAACGQTPLNFGKFAHVPTNVKSLVTSNPSFSSFTSQLSQYQSFKAYPNLVQELSTAAEALEGEDMEAVLVRYIYASSGGKTQVDIMPIFDPTCDLGRLILAGRKSLSKKVTVPPEHAQLLAERLATVQQQRLRVQRLLLQIQELDYLIAPAQRANIPKKWLYLARDLPSVDDEKESEESLGVASAQLLAASPSTVAAANCPDQCQKATLSVPLENGAVDCCKSNGIVLNADVEDVFNGPGTSTTSPDMLSPAIEAVFTTAVQAPAQSDSADTTNEDGLNTAQSAKESIGVMHSIELEQYSTREQTRECAVLEPIQYDHDQAPESFNLAVAGSTVATSCDTSQTDPVEEYLAALNELTFINTIHLDDPEINGLPKSLNLTVGQLKIMPVFDPRSALGRLILADRQPMHKGISVPPQYAQLLQESQASVRNRRARARCLLQQVHSLEPLVPAEHRMKIPTRWEFLARDPIWCRDGAAASSPHDNSVSLTRKEKKLRKRNRAVEDEHDRSMEFAANKRPTVLQPSTMNAGGGAHQNQRACVENGMQGPRTLFPTLTRAAQAKIGDLETLCSATAADCTDSRAIHSPVSVGTAKKVPVETLEASTTGNTQLQAQNSATGGGFTKIDSMESEVIHDIVLSEQDVIRLELARMKKMYDDWLSQ